jgi:hypothetical protein
MCHLMVSNVFTPSLGHLNERIHFYNIYVPYIHMQVLYKWIWMHMSTYPLACDFFYMGHEKWKELYDHEQMCKFLDVKLACGTFINMTNYGIYVSGII